MTLVGERVFIAVKGESRTWTDIVFLTPADGSWNGSVLENVWDNPAVMSTDITETPSFEEVSVIALGVRGGFGDFPRGVRGAFGDLCECGRCCPLPKLM